MQNTIKVKFSLAFITFLLTLGLGSCNLFKEKVNEVRSFTTDLESRSFSACWKGLESVIEGDAHSGRHFSRISNQHPLGLSYESELPNFIKTKNFALDVQFYYRIQNPKNKAVLVVSVTLGDSLIYQQNYIVSGDSAVNRWAIFKAKTNFPGNLPPNAVLSVTLHNQGKSLIDIDDYTVSFLRIGRPSFLISDKKSKERSFFSGFSFRPVYKNRFYTISYSDKLGDVQIRSIKNEMIFSSLKYYVQWIKGRDTLFCYANKLTFIPGDKDEIGISGETDICNFTLKLILNETSPLMKAESKTVFKDSVQLLRESLIFSYAPDIAEVYRKNTLIDSKRIRNEYWLDKEGVKIGSNSKSAYIYHTPEISSIQLSTKLCELYINLDFYRDHPLAQLTLQAPSSKSLEDISCNRYKEGSSRENSFQFFVGSDIGSLPRFMKSPNGFLSTYVLTQETDCIDPQTKLSNGIGSGTPYVRNSYYNYFSNDSSYNFYGHLIYPYPGFGDFFPTPNYWTNTAIAQDIYSWKPNPFINQSNKWDSIFTAQRLRDFVTNRGIVFSNCMPDIQPKKIDSIMNLKEFNRIQTKLPFYSTKRLVNFTTVKEIMEYWLALEKIKIRFLPDGKFRLYNSSYQDIKGLSLAVRADSVFINNKKTQNYYKDIQGDIIVWFDLPALKSAIVGTKR